jgi:hypothetical protein
MQHLGMLLIPPHVLACKECLDWGQMYHNLGRRPVPLLTESTVHAAGKRGGCADEIN